MLRSRRADEADRIFPDFLCVPAQPHPDVKRIGETGQVSVGKALAAKLVRVEPVALPDALAAAECLRKPLDLDQLFAKVAQHCGKPA